MAVMKPLVSVIVPSYNAGAFLALLIEAVKAQTYDRWELLILDDGAGDLDHPAVKPCIDDERIKSFRWRPNRGVSQATLFLMQQVQGDFWSYPGADDILYPQFIEKRLLLMQQYPEASVVFGKGDQIDSQGNHIWFDLDRKTQELMSPLEDKLIEASTMLKLLLAGNIITTTSVFARSRPTLSILTRYHINWRYSQDWFYWLLLAGNSLNFFYSAEILHSYRFHEKSLSQSRDTWAWRCVEPSLVVLTSMALAAQTGELAMQCFHQHRIEMYANWLVRGVRFRHHQSWHSWCTLATLASIRWFEWPRVLWNVFTVLRTRRILASRNKVIHGLPSAYLSNPILATP